MDCTKDCIYVAFEKKTMAGICLELFHLGDALSDCAVCFQRRSRTMSECEDDNQEADVSLTVHAHTLIDRSDYQMLPGYYGASDYLDACGQRIQDTMMSSTSVEKSRMTVEGLLSMSPIVNGRDIVQMAARHQLLSLVKSQDCVHEIFFPNHKKNRRFLDVAQNSGFDLGLYARLFASQTICDINDEYNFHGMLDENKVYAALETTYTGPHWKKLGFSLYTTLFQNLVKDEKSKTPFSAYLQDDRQMWARRMAERVQERQWAYANLIKPIVQGQPNDDYNRDLNILFIKLHLLDPATVMPTFDHVRRVIPDLNLELVTTNYLGAALDVSQIKQDVFEAIQRPVYPVKGKGGQAGSGGVWSRFTSPRSQRIQSRCAENNVDEVFFGIDVQEFIMNEAKPLGLWTGIYPNNRRVGVDSLNASRCLIM